MSQGMQIVWTCFSVFMAGGVMAGLSLSRMSWQLFVRGVPEDIITNGFFYKVFRVGVFLFALGAIGTLVGVLVDLSGR